jgi:protein involved in polysaccharide export with SLBB domain
MKKLFSYIFILITNPFTFLPTIELTAAQEMAKNDSVKAPVFTPTINNWDFHTGDAIRITATPDTGFPNGIYPVDGDGFVDLPIIGPLNVKSMDKASFEKAVGDHYIPLLRYSSIQVRRMISISFQGGFRNPGVYWISPGATLWYALSLAGGPVREDGLKRIKWERGGTTFKQKIPDLIEMPETISELGFKSGDVIRVLIRPKRTGWEVFRQEIIPIIGLGSSSAIAAFYIHQWSKGR